MPDTIKFSAKNTLSLRRKFGISQRTLATLLGVNHRTVLQWEKDRFLPNEQNLAAINNLAKLSKEEVRTKVEKINPRLVQRTYLFSPKRMRDFRMKMRITQSNLALLLDVTYFSIHRWESGKQHPEYDMVEKINHILNYSKDEVYAILADKDPKALANLKNGRRHCRNRIQKCAEERHYKSVTKTSNAVSDSATAKG